MAVAVSLAGVAGAEEVAVQEAIVPAASAAPTVEAAGSDGTGAPMGTGAPAAGVMVTTTTAAATELVDALGVDIAQTASAAMMPAPASAAEAGVREESGGV